MTGFNTQGPGLTNSYTYGQSGFNSPLYANNYNPNQYMYGGSINYQSPYSTPMMQSSNISGMIGGITGGYGSGGGSMSKLSKAAGIANAGIQTATTVAGITQDYRSTSRLDVGDAVSYQNYDPENVAPVYVDDVMPEEIMKGTGGRAALSYAGKGASAGAALGSIIPGVGTAIGAGVGAAAGLVAGAFKGKKAREKREEFEDLQDQKKSRHRDALQRYYDMNAQRERNYAQQQQFNQRSGNFDSLYRSSIYGIGGY